MPKPRKNVELLDADEPWVSLTEAARMLGLHRQRVLLIALKGKLVMDFRGKLAFVSRESIDKYLDAGQ